MHFWRFLFVHWAELQDSIRTTFWGLLRAIYVDCGPQSFRVLIVDLWIIIVIENWSGRGGSWNSEPKSDLVAASSFVLFLVLIGFIMSTTFENRDKCVVVSWPHDPPQSERQNFQELLQPDRPWALSSLNLWANWAWYSEIEEHVVRPRVGFQKMIWLQYHHCWAGRVCAYEELFRKNENYSKIKFELLLIVLQANKYWLRLLSW